MRVVAEVEIGLPDSVGPHDIKVLRSQYKRDAILSSALITGR